MSLLGAGEGRGRNCGVWKEEGEECGGGADGVSGMGVGYVRVVAWPWGPWPPPCCCRSTASRTRVTSIQEPISSYRSVDGLIVLSIPLEST